MAGQSSAMFGWGLTEVSVLGSLVFGRALTESCEGGNLVILEGSTFPGRSKIENKKSFKISRSSATIIQSKPV